MTARRAIAYLRDCDICKQTGKIVPDRHGVALCSPCKARFGPQHSSLGEAIGEIAFLRRMLSTCTCGLKDLGVE